MLTMDFVEVSHKQRKTRDVRIIVRDSSPVMTMVLFRLTQKTQQQQLLYGATVGTWGLHVILF